MIEYWKHFKYTMIHKFWVMVFCFEIGLYKRGIMHDMSKFRLSEFVPYAKHFFGKPIPDECWHGDVRNVVPYEATHEYYKTSFDKAWLRHQNRNSHHWHFFVSINYEGELKLLDMEWDDILEMLCDWRSAAKSKGTSDGSWKATLNYYNENKHRMMLSDNTRWKVEYVLKSKVNAEN